MTTDDKKAEEMVEQTDNELRPEDGDQDVSQDPNEAYGEGGE